MDLDTTSDHTRGFTKCTQVTKWGRATWFSSMTAQRPSRQRDTRTDNGFYLWSTAHYQLHAWHKKSSTRMSPRLRATGANRLLRNPTWKLVVVFEVPLKLVEPFPDHNFPIKLLPTLRFTLFIRKTSTVCGTWFSVEQRNWKRKDYTTHTTSLNFQRENVSGILWLIEVQSLYLCHCCREHIPNVSGCWFTRSPSF